MKLRRSEHLCPKFQAAMDVLARPWNGLIIATLEQGGALRFSELRERLAAMGDRMLADRLKDLEAYGLVVREVSPGPPVRVAYALTEVGHGFREVQSAIGRWGERFASASAGRRRRSAARNADRRNPRDATLG
ncbi:MAG TPA: helix-turn-helix domain-containing protein [Alphaproteobacteria bacterium]|nr:helix-turn-helix domain-containing protein [Alphaproteobacteria bacterium]